MISELDIRRFKSIHQALIKLGPLTVFIGPNAGGKSNILDAIRVLQGIGSGYTIREVFDGRREDATRQR